MPPMASKTPFAVDEMESNKGGGVGLTVTLNELVAPKLGDPLSLTLTTKSLVVSDCAMSGRQVRIPEAAFSVALVGDGLSRLKVNVCPGRSGSTAPLVTTRV